MIAFILAGGFATRLWPLTEKRAKPLLPLAGKPILSHIVEKLPSDMSIVISTNAAFGTEMQGWADAIPNRKIDVVVEHTKSDDEKLGALGAVAQWIDEQHIQDDILLLTGDNYIGFNMNTFIDQYTPHTPLVAAFDIGSLDQAKKFGTVIADASKKNVIAFEEKPAEPKSTLVSTGCSIIPAEHLGLLQDFAAKHPDNVGGIFEEFLRQNVAVRCFTFTEPWFDIGSFETYIEATRALVGHNVLKSDDVTTNALTTNGSVVIGKKSSIQSSSLQDTVIFEGCTIEDCVLEECIIDDNCVLKGVDLRGKMLRAGTTLIRGSP